MFFSLYDWEMRGRFAKGLAQRALANIEKVKRELKHPSRGGRKRACRIERLGVHLGSPDAGDTLSLALKDELLLSGGIAKATTQKSVRKGLRE